MVKCCHTRRELLDFTNCPMCMIPSHVILSITEWHVCAIFSFLYYNLQGKNNFFFSKAIKSGDEAIETRRSHFPINFHEFYLFNYLCILFLVQWCADTFCESTWYLLEDRHRIGPSSWKTYKTSLIDDSFLYLYLVKYLSTLTLQLSPFFLFLFFYWNCKFGS